MSIFLLILGSIVAADIAWWWFVHRLCNRLAHPGAWKWGVGLFMGVQLGLILWIIAARRIGPDTPGPPDWVMSFVYLWHLLVMPATLLVALMWGLFAGVRTGWDRLRGKPAPTVDSARRRFIASAAIAAPPVLTGGLVGYSIPHLQQFRVRRINVPIPGLPPELEGVRIAHVSDLHVGTFTNDRLLRRIVSAVSAMDADLVVMPGDLINNRLSDLSAALDAVTNIQTRHAPLLCIGNHDLIEDGETFIRRAKERADLLINESRTLTIRGREVQVLGLPWARQESRIREMVASIARQVRPGALPILLAHHPHAFDAAAEAGIPLTLSGHTHGGQLMLNERVGFGPAMFRYWTGLYRKGGSSLVVSNGVGHWYPVRIAAPAEIIVVVLTAA
jgi:predicted MPP superfamily phosphohydrolase